MRITFRWLRVLANSCLFTGMLVAAFNYQTSVYLIYQAQGQLSLLMGTEPLEMFAGKKTLTEKERDNIQLISRIKNYSVDSLGYKPTGNFTTLYDQRNKPVLWVITASEPYALIPYEWKFPVVGRVSYKGFFKKPLAEKEYNHLRAQGYDVDLRSVSAWSTLGWFSDPVLSSMLQRSKGSLCNLLFHELFHATYYASSSVDFNENIAGFIAHKATLQFLENDSAALKQYVDTYEDNKVFNAYMLRSMERLKNYYEQIREKPDRYPLKLRAIFDVADSIQHLPLKDKTRYMARREDMLEFKNAYFVDFVQYDSMQDSLELVFNKIYRGNIAKMVQDLRLN